MGEHPSSDHPEAAGARPPAASSTPEGGGVSYVRDAAEVMFLLGLFIFVILVVSVNGINP